MVPHYWFSGQSIRLFSSQFFSIIFKLQPPSQLKTLDDLIAQAGHYAEFCMRSSGSMPPTLFLIGSDGPMMMIPKSMAGEQDKDDFATTSCE